MGHGVMDRACARPPSVSRGHAVVPVTKCRLRKLRMERVKDYLLLEQEFIANQEAFKPSEEKTEVSPPNHTCFILSFMALVCVYACVWLIVSLCVCVSVGLCVCVRVQADRTKVEDLRGSPMQVGTLEEIIDDNHGIISTPHGLEQYVGICSFVDKDQIEPGCTVLLHNKVSAVVRSVWVDSQVG